MIVTIYGENFFIPNKMLAYVISFSYTISLRCPKVNFRNEVIIMANRKVTGRVAASKASQTMRSVSTGKASKTAGGSALSQRKAPSKQTSDRAASIASKVLRDGRTSAASKSAAGSALAQTRKKH